MDALSATTATVASIIGAVIALAAMWIIRDYNEWISFGTGGTSPTLAGYWRMTKFRLLCLQSADDLRDPTPIGNEGPKYLSNLPARKGERPQIIARTMPQRQKPEKIDPAVAERLHNLPKKYTEQRPDFLVLDLSKTEGRSTDAIYAKPDLPGRDPSAQDKMLGSEIAHVHPADNSLHVWLSPVDATQAVEKGWGERFPLSSLGMLHPSWIMVYAPKNMEEVDTIEEIIKAGIGYLTGEKI